MHRPAAAILRAIIVGPPGSGKGTVSDRIIKKFKIHHLSSGDILRQHIRNETELGLEARKFIGDGLLVPDHLVTKLILTELSGVEDRSWLLDGFPRTVAQAKDLDEHHRIDTVINLDVPFDTIIDRISKRWIHGSSGRTYNLDFSPPATPGKDDITGEPLIQREDDKPESVKKRLELYAEVTAPILDHYGRQNKVESFSGTETNVIWPLIEKFLCEKIE